MDKPVAFLVGMALCYIVYAVLIAAASLTMTRDAMTIIVSSMAGAGILTICSIIGAWYKQRRTDKLEALEGMFFGDV